MPIILLAFLLIFVWVMGAFHTKSMLIHALAYDGFDEDWPIIVFWPIAVAIILVTGYDDFMGRGDNNNRKED